MKYAIELLQRQLVFETECREDASAFLMSLGEKARIADRHQTRLAFQESLRLADERIPQLTQALEILLSKE